MDPASYPDGPSQEVGDLRWKLKDARDAQRSSGISEVAGETAQRIINEELRALLTSIVESTDDAVMSTDLNGTLVSWNTGAERILGYSDKEIIGRSVYTLIPADAVAQTAQVLQRIHRGEKVEYFRSRTRGKRRPANPAVFNGFRGSRCRRAIRGRIGHRP